MRKRLFLFCLSLPVLIAGRAQVSVSYKHDDSKMNQITVMESGMGSLTPSWYYNMLHNNYSSGAASKNKTLFRTTAGINLYNQKDDAEEIDSALVKRAAIEALNVADRSGGALDLAWKVEGPKINEKMSALIANINRIRTIGGSEDEYNYWLQYYNVYQSAIKSTQDAYMPNAQRKREYLRIYQDANRKNDLLVRYLVRLSNKRKIVELLSAGAENRSADKSGIVGSAMGRWKASGMSTSSAPIVSGE